MTREHVVLMSLVGEPATGLWCDKCLLPSVVECRVALTDEQGSTVGVIRRCVEGCG